MVEQRSSAPAERARWLPPLVAGALASITMLLGWRGVDWPAQLYRVQLFRHHGWLAFDTGWYGGHYPLAYSALFPPLAATFGVTATAFGAPSARHFRATSESRPARRAERATETPRFARASAVASPIPEDAPVTTTR